MNILSLLHNSYNNNFINKQIFQNHFQSNLFQSSLFHYKFNTLSQLPFNPQTMSNQYPNNWESGSVQIKKQKQTRMKPSDKNVSQTNHNQICLMMKMIYSMKKGFRGNNLSNRKYSQSKKNQFSNLSQFNKSHYLNLVHFLPTLLHKWWS